MKFSEYLKPALGVAFVAALAVGYYWFEHRPRAEEKDTPGQALVIVTKATNACFSDMVRVTGFIVPRREAQIGVDQEGSKVTDLFVREGDMVTDNQELARLTAPPQRRLRRRPDRCSGFPSTTKSNWMPKCRASICSSSILAPRCGSAATTH